MTYLNIAGSGSTPVTQSASGTVSNNDSYQTVASVTLGRSGVWSIYVRGTGDASSDAPAQSYLLQVGGANVDSDTADAGGTESLHCSIGLRYAPTYIASGTVVSFLASTPPASGGSTVSGSLYCHFIPTPAYRA